MQVRELLQLKAALAAQGGRGSTGDRFLHEPCRPARGTSTPELNPAP